MRSFSGIEPHTSLRIEVKIRFSGTWIVSPVSNADKILIKADGTNTPEVIRVSNPCPGINICDALADGLMMVSVNVTHSVSTLFLKFDSAISNSESITSYSIRDVKIWIDRCYKTCAVCSGPLPTQCTACPTHGSLQVDGTCKCDMGFYLYNYLCVPSCDLALGFINDSDLN